MTEKNEVEQIEDKENSENSTLDTNVAAVKKFIKDAKKRGFVTLDEINKYFPQDEFSSEQLDEIMAQLSDLGINITENEEDTEKCSCNCAESKAKNSKPNSSKVTTKVIEIVASSKEEALEKFKQLVKEGKIV